MAILAGDALVARAFELLTSEVPNRSLACDLVSDLAHGAGWAGMIGGQAADLLGEAEPPSLEKVQYIHARKTASLFSAACRMGARVGGASSAHFESLGRYGQALGQAFQIADDLLDVTPDARTNGEQVAKNTEAGKPTFPRCMGTEASRAAAQDAVREAIAELKRFGPAADDLRALTHYVVARTY